MMTKSSSEDKTEGAFNDVLRIRDTIFGQQLAEHDDRFAAQASRLDKLQAQLRTLDATMEGRQKRAEEDHQNEIDALRTILESELDTLDFKTSGRVDLRNMLVDLGEKLKQDGT
ncbi:MAG: hypothetical protein GY759_03450 [Chloroflexi bacterium]|nr:hypothetical protein [Chloroflexota bacterium]